jgi:hypothetical protein
MSRLFGLVVLAVLLWFVLEVAWSRLRISISATVRPISPPPRPPEPVEIAETLVRCSGCGTHVPSRMLAEGLCERCSPHPRPLSQPHTRTPGRGVSARSDS